MANLSSRIQGILNAGFATASAYGLVKGGSVPGKTDGIATSSGYIGQVITSSAGSGSISSGSPKDMATIVLSPGVWLLYGSAQASVSGTPGGSPWADISISPTSVTQNSTNGTFSRFNMVAQANANAVNSTGPIIINTSSSPTYYLVGTYNFTTATITVNSNSQITAVRIA